MIGKGWVIAIGGNENKRGGKQSILAEFVRLAGGSEARVVIIPSASVEPVRRAARYRKLFSKLGAASVIAIHAENGVTPDELLLIENASGIFVTGGDQARLMEHLRGTGAAQSIVNAVRGGAVYAGTSAGASAVSERMIVGREQPDGSEIVEVCEGLGLVPGAIVDQHFRERDRLGRLLSVVRDQRLHGVGIDEDTAVVWRANGEMRVSGRGSVTVIDPAISRHLLLTDGATTTV
ncbi:MAG TPA: cyanophycinase [Thermoanaerobaculia bacterium]|jgi:cyanophycinase